MLALDVESFMIEFKDGVIKNVGPPTKAATAKLFDVESVSVREFGDSQVKLRATDDEGNELQVALFPEQATAIAESVAELAEDSEVFE